MNRDKLLTALELLKKNGVLCYVYRESVFELLSMNRADGVVHLLSDTPAEDLKTILVKCGFKDAASGKEENISARLSGQAAEILCISDLEPENFDECIRRDLTVHSMMMRSNGDIYDNCGGLEDFRQKRLHLTGGKIVDKDSFAISSFELMLKSGYTADAGIQSTLNKALAELPVGKRVSLIMMLRNYMKAENADVQHILCILSLKGIFPKAPTVSCSRPEKLMEKLKGMKPLQVSALVCTLCGIKGENLKQIPNVGFAREFYDCIQRHIGSDLGNRKQFEEAKNSCTAECFETLLAVKEALCLISGQEFHLAQEKPRELLKAIDASDKWQVQKENEEKARPPASASKEVPEEQPETEPAPEMMEFEGEAEEQYIEEEEEQEQEQEDDAVSNLPLRDPSKNFYIHRK